MEVDDELFKLLSHLYYSLSEQDVIALDLFLRSCSHGLWPILEPLTARAVLIKMQELGLWKVDHRLKECRLSRLSDVLGYIRRLDLSAAVNDYG